MKKYTNKILLITAIILTLGFVIGYTITFQVRYHRGEITFEKADKESWEFVIDEQIDELGSSEDDENSENIIEESSSIDKEIINNNN